MGSTEKFCLRWNDFEANISSAFRDLKEEKDFSDVTLVCADQQVEAHKVILAACSPFFKKVLRKAQHSHPLIYMRGVKFSDMEAVLSFVYHGEVNMAQADLKNFLAVAEELEVKGLTCGKNLSEGSSNHLPQPPSNHHLHQSNSNHQPQITAPPLPKNSAQACLQTPIKTEQEWSASENNNNSGGAVHAKRKSEPNHLVNNLQAPVEEVDQYAGYEDFNQDGGDEVDLNNYIAKISEGQFKCNICGQVSSRKGDLRKHVENKHFPGLFEYSCDQCEKKFNTKNKYYIHRSRHNSNNE